MRVGEIMSKEPVVLRAKDKLAEAAREMERSSVRHLPIIDDKGVLVGLLTDRDLRALEGRAGPVTEVMRTDVKTVSAGTAAHEAAYLLVRHKIGCVPVTDDDGKLVGIVTESDFVRLAYTLLGGKVPIDQLELEEHEADGV
jgi:CBS domain-containing protein